MSLFKACWMSHSNSIVSLIREVYMFRPWSWWWRLCLCSSCWCSVFYFTFSFFYGSVWSDTNKWLIDWLIDQLIWLFTAGYGLRRHYWMLLHNHLLRRAHPMCFTSSRMHITVYMKRCWRHLPLLCLLSNRFMAISSTFLTVSQLF